MGNECQHKWKVIYVYRDPLTRNVRAKLAKCEFCPEAKLIVSIQELFEELKDEKKFSEASIVEDYSERPFGVI